MVVPFAAYREYSMRALRSGRNLRRKTHRSDPVSRYRSLEIRSVTKRRPELVVQTSAAVNVRWLNFPNAWYTVACTFVPHRRHAGDTSKCDGWVWRGVFCFRDAWSASGCGLAVSSEATMRASSSMRS
jgi:hypothetical protein